MSNRPLLVGPATVEVDQARYDELLRKEEKLRLLMKLVGKSFEKPEEVTRVIFLEEVICENDS